jgi:Leucine-rich repeat (LRR) protein
MFLAFFLLPLAYPLATATLPSQIQALELLFNSTLGDQWRWKSEAVNGPSWTFSSPQADPCNDQNRVWQGITCSSPPTSCQLQSCEIVSLSLGNYDLKGSLPIEFFVHLTTLTNLEIFYSRDLIGKIPSEIGSLSLLVRLFLDNNQLTGSIPSEIGSLSQLGTLSLDNNQLTGSIPSSIGLLAKLGALLLYFNDLTGSIPSEIGSLKQLEIFSLYNNQLTGTLPSTIGSLSQLSTLFLYYNQLTGTIPSSIGPLSRLVFLYLCNNQLTGSIPSEVGSLSRLLRLFLFNNHLTGTIPSEIGSLAQLGSLYLYNNQLTGTIPSSISFLPILDSLFLYFNHLTGPIPSEIGSLAQLGSLYLYNNELAGSIPSEIGSLSQLDVLDLSYNELTGSIPSEIGSLSQLNSLDLSDNHLTGTLPSSFSTFLNLVWLHAQANQLDGQLSFPLNLPNLEQLFLHQNHFTGNLEILFSSVSFVKLLNLDMSDNLFSGSIPSTLFRPHLQSISLSLNCFEHELPSSICDAKDAGVISMDGLGSAKGCKNVVTVPFTSVSLVRSLEGSIPDCVWSMSNLKLLNLAGNGLRGRVGSASSMPSLLSLTLSHNHLSGEIPSWLQQLNLSHLDLSHNKLTGDVNGFRCQNYSWNSERSQYLSRSLSLAVNRLSGNLPDLFEKYSELDILSGNLFGCANPPKNDKSSDSVSCGSQDYDQTLTLMGAMLGSVVCLILFSLLYSYVRHDRREVHKFFLIVNLSFGKNVHSFPSTLALPKNKMFSTPPSSPLQSIFSFQSLLIQLACCVCVLTTLCLLLSFPIYSLKQSDVELGAKGDPQYVTHSHMYNWLWTMAFLSGTIPAILLLTICLICLSYFVFATNLLARKADQGELPSRLSISNLVKDNQHLGLLVWIIFILNVVVVGTVNGLYLWSTLLELASDIRIWIQFSFGLFSFLWSVVLRHRLPYKIKDSNSGVWLFTCLNVMNSVVIPCVVTALSSPSCYQRLLIPPDEISSSYSYQSCVLTGLLPDGNTVCLHYGLRIMDVLKITPPFFYSYQCGSILLTSYIPVYMYSISLQLISSIATFVFILVFNYSSTKACYPRWLMNYFPGICWPSLWIDADLSKAGLLKKPIRLINPHQIISRMMNNIILLLSFGLCSPVLCCYIALNICIHLCSWFVLIGRFVYVRLNALSSVATATPGLLPFPVFGLTLSQDQDQDHPANEDQLLLLLSTQLDDVNSSVLVCIWPVILTSCSFMTLLSWDVAGDQGGWFQALWVPITGVGITLLLWVWDQILISSKFLDQACSRNCFSLFSFLANQRHSERVTVSSSLEIVHSSLHQPPVRSLDGTLDDELEGNQDAL